MTLSWTPPDALPNVIDGTEAIRVVVRGAPTVSDAGTVSYSSTNYDCDDAKRLRVTIREAETSGGKLHTNDVKFHVLASDLPGDPAQGNDYVLTGALYDTRWDIIFVEKILHGTRYRLFCRRS